MPEFKKIKTYKMVILFFLKGNLSPVRIFKQCKQLKVAFWPLKPTKCLFFKGNLESVRKKQIFKPLKVALWPLKLIKCLFLKGNLALARKIEFKTV